MQFERKRFMVARVNTLDQNTAAAESSEASDAIGSQSEQENEPLSKGVQRPLDDSFDFDVGPEEPRVEDSHVQKTWAHLSLRHLTRDVVPKFEHYRNLSSIVGRPLDASIRPTLDYLHNPLPEDCEATPLATSSKQERSSFADEVEIQKFGWIKGVFVRCLLNIWGVMLFLRLSWVTAQAGILGGIGIVLAANIVTFITALSMSAISTNGQIKGGGTYFMISRSLGPEFGGSIGLIFAFANAMASAMYIVGFCESLLSLLNIYDLRIVDGAINDTRIIGLITLGALFIICFLGGMALEAITQLVLLGILVIAMGDVLVGVFIGPRNEEQISQGFIGFNKTLLWNNLLPDFRPFDGVQQSFFSVFAVFFPACTGILAGANISGDLKDPSSAIPKGTLLAILTTFLSYVKFIVLIGATVSRDATGVVDSVSNWTFLNCSSLNETDTCSYGTHNNFQVLELISLWGPLIYGGCFAATLSSALASLVSAPKVFQALCKDKVFPLIEVFGRGFGKRDEPYVAYALTGVIAAIFIGIGELNEIASIISNFFLAAYALINYACFHSSYQKCPGWRPTFKYYNMWLSLLGAVLCGVVMFLIDWRTALITVLIVISLYLIVAYRKLDINWGSSVQSESYRQAMNAVFSLNRFDDHVKTFRPQILLFAGDPSDRPPLVHFAHSLTKNMALLVVANCSEEEEISYRLRAERQRAANKWLQKEKIKAFYSLANAPRMDKAAKEMMSLVGLGKLKPNIVMFGYKHDWTHCLANSLKGYFQTIHAALDFHYAVCILRIPGKMNFSDIFEAPLLNHDVKEEGNTDCKKEFDAEAGYNISKSCPSSEENLSSINPPNGRQVTPQKEECTRSEAKSLLVPAQINEMSETGSYASSRKSSANSDVIDARAGSYLELRSSKKPSPEPSPKKTVFKWKGSGDLVSCDVLENMNMFKLKQPAGTIDVWWLFDDGGLTLLLPYILTTRTLWENCKLRIFCLCSKRGDLETEHRKMSELIRKFRIDISDVIMIEDIHKRPEEESMKTFNDLINKFRERSKTKSSEEEIDKDLLICEDDLKLFQDKTRRQVRLKELLLEHSSQASLIVMTLPFPTKGRIPAPLYMAWLETLTKDLPPFLLVRGNQSSVLTFYS